MFTTVQNFGLNRFEQFLDQVESDVYSLTSGKMNVDQSFIDSAGISSLSLKIKGIAAVKLGALASIGFGICSIVHVVATLISTQAFVSLIYPVSLVVFPIFLGHDLYRIGKNLQNHMRQKIIMHSLQPAKIENFSDLLSAHILSAVEPLVDKKISVKNRAIVEQFHSTFDQTYFKSLILCLPKILKKVVKQ